MTDIQNIYSILLSRGYQDQLFSSLTGSRKKEGKEVRADCPLCKSEGNFSYSSQKPLWRCWSCGESGDWIQYLQKTSGYDFQRCLLDLATVAGVSIDPHIQSTYQVYTRKADILETAQKYFMDQLQDRKAEEVWQYVWKRGYDFDSIYDMELGAYTDRQALLSYLKAEGYTDQEIKASGLLTSGYGEDYQLTLLWKDQAGRAIGIVGRPILADAEIKARGLSKYKYSAGMEKDKGLIGFSSSRGSDQMILVEGVLDALYLNHKGFKSVAVGGTSLSATQLQALEVSGTKEILLAMDMDDPGQKATERLIKSLSTSKLRAYVVSLPDGYKDPDELVRKAGAEAFQEALDKAERWPSWMARRIVSRHDLTSDRGMDQAIEEALEIYTGLDDSLQARGFMDSLRQATGLDQDDLDSKLIKATEKASVSKAKAILQSHLTDLQLKATEGDITGAEAGLTKALRDISTSRGVMAPEPYLLADLEEDIQATSPA
jgi:DNA primase